MTRPNYNIGHRAFSLPLAVPLPVGREPVAPVTLEGRLVGTEGAGILAVVHLVTGEGQAEDKERLTRLINRRVRLRVEEIESDT